MADMLSLRLLLVVTMVAMVPALTNRERSLISGYSERSGSGPGCQGLRVVSAPRRSSSYFIVEADGMPNHPIYRTNQHDKETKRYSFYVLNSPIRMPEPTCLPPNQPVGFAVNGVPIYSPVSEAGVNLVQGAGAEEVDGCGGRVDSTGTYYYTTAPSLDCLYPSPQTSEKLLIGMALDGFLIYSLNSTADKVAQKEAGLDVCRGKMEDGVYVYYVADHFPYTLGCFRGYLSQYLDRRVRPANCPAETTKQDALCACQVPSEGASNGRSATRTVFYDISDVTTGDRRRGRHCWEELSKATWCTQNATKPRECDSTEGPAPTYPNLDPGDQGQKEYGGEGGREGGRESSGDNRRENGNREAIQNDDDDDNDNDDVEDDNEDNDDDNDDVNNDVEDDDDDDNDNDDDNNINDNNENTASDENRHEDRNGEDGGQRGNGERGEGGQRENGERGEGGQRENGERRQGGQRQNGERGERPEQGQDGGNNNEEREEVPIPDRGTPGSQGRLFGQRPRPPGYNRTDTFHPLPPSPRDVGSPSGRPFGEDAVRGPRGPPPDQEQCECDCSECRDSDPGGTDAGVHPPPAPFRPDMPRPPSGGRRASPRPSSSQSSPSPPAQQGRRMDRPASASAPGTAPGSRQMPPVSVAPPDMGPSPPSQQPRGDADRPGQPGRGARIPDRGSPGNGPQQRPRAPGNNRPDTFFPSPPSPPRDSDRDRSGRPRRCLCDCPRCAPRGSQDSNNQGDNDNFVPQPPAPPQPNRPMPPSDRPRPSPAEPGTSPPGQRPRLMNAPAPPRGPARPPGSQQEDQGTQGSPPSRSQRPSSRTREQTQTPTGHPNGPMAPGSPRQQPDTAGRPQGSPPTDGEGREQSPGPEPQAPGSMPSIMGSYVDPPRGGQRQGSMRRPRAKGTDGQSPNEPGEEGQEPAGPPSP